MNILDLIVYLVVVLAVWNGWRRGFILQICSLVALVAAIWCAIRFGAEVGTLLRIDAQYADAAGFVVVLVAALLLISVLARVVRRIFRFAGFGLFDTLLGILVAVVKYLLVMSVLFVALDRINVNHALIPAETIASSRTYQPIRALSGSLLPLADWVSEQMGDGLDAFTEKADETTREVPGEEKI